MFDISDAKRLRKVAKVLESYGTRVQYSIFEIKTNQKSANQMQKKISKIITGQDRLHYFNLCNKDLGARKIQ